MTAGNDGGAQQEPETAVDTSTADQELETGHPTNAGSTDDPNQLPGQQGNNRTEDDLAVDSRAHRSVYFPFGQRLSEYNGELLRNTGNWEC